MRIDNMITKPAFGKLVAWAAAVALLSSLCLAPAWAAPEEITVEIPAGEQSFSIELAVDVDGGPFVGIEAMMSISDASALEFISFQKNGAYANTAAVNGSIDGQHVFGFFTYGNAFAGGRITVGALNFGGYTGDGEVTITMREIHIYRYDEHKNVDVEKHDNEIVFTVKRESGGGQPTPTASPLPTPTGGAEEPIPTPTPDLTPTSTPALAPTPTGGAEEPAATPTPTGGAEEPLLTPTPTGGAEEPALTPTPTGGAEEPIPTPTGGAEEPALTPTPVLTLAPTPTPSGGSSGLPSGNSGGGAAPTSVPTPSPTLSPTIAPTPTLSPTPIPTLTSTPLPTQSGGAAGGATLINGQETPLGFSFFEEHMQYIGGYPDGTVGPDASITRAEAVTIFYRLIDDSAKEAPIAATFNDVPADEWYAQQVAYAAQKGIVVGYEDGGFHPEDQITRVEFATIMSRFVPAATGAARDFPDVPADHWALGYIRTCVANGWIVGYEDGTFAPESPISRAEAVTILNRALGRAIAPEDIPAGVPSYSDLPADHWAYAQIIEASAAHTFTLNANGTELWD